MNYGYYFRTHKLFYAKCFACVDFLILPELFIYMIYLVFCAPCKTFSQLEPYLVSFRAMMLSDHLPCVFKFKEHSNDPKDLQSYFKANMSNCYSFLLWGHPRRVIQRVTGHIHSPYVSFISWWGILKGDDINGLPRCPSNEGSWWQFLTQQTRACLGILVWESGQFIITSAWFLSCCCLLFSQLSTLFKY